VASLESKNLVECYDDLFISETEVTQVAPDNFRYFISSLAKPDDNHPTLG
jgi:hypothetical protein